MLTEKALAIRALAGWKGIEYFAPPAVIGELQKLGDSFDAAKGQRANRIKRQWDAALSAAWEKYGPLFKMED